MFLLRRGLAASVGAVILSLSMAPTVAATTWDPPTNLGPGYGTDLETLGGERAAVVYLVAGSGAEDPADLYIRRRVSAKGHPVWLARQLLATNALFSPSVSRPQLASAGDTVDVLWVTNRGRVAYRRSTDGGSSFAPTRYLSPKDHRAEEISLARRGDLVVVAWDPWSPGTGLFLRVSTDGGASFGPRMQFAGGSPSMAIGKGVVYLAYRRGAQGLYLRRSFDSGAKWTRQRQLSATASSYFTLWGNFSATGDMAYVAYTSWAGGDSDPVVLHRRSLDQGATWGPATPIDPATGFDVGSFGPVINIEGGLVQAVWERCTGASCSSGNLYHSYRTASGWLTPSFLSSAGWPSAVGMAEKIIVTYGNGTLFARTGTP